MGSLAHVRLVDRPQKGTGFHVLVIYFLKTGLIKSLLFTEAKRHSTAELGQTGELLPQNPFVWAHICAQTFSYEAGGQRDFTCMFCIRFGTEKVD